MKQLKTLSKYLPARDKNPPNKKEYKYISKKIFQTWDTNQVSSGMYDAVYTWIDKNPDWEYHFFDDKACRNFIKDNFPKKVLDAYDAIIPGAFKADLWRYCVLYIHGGVYVDNKSELLASLNDVIPNDVEFLTVRDCSLNQKGIIESYVRQSFLCARPKHEFFLKAIDLIVSHVKEGYYGFEPTSPTGPIVLGRAMNFCLCRDEYTPHSVGINNIGSFKYIIWPPILEGNICTDGRGETAFNYEYATYRMELSSYFKQNISHSWRYCWAFKKVYTDGKCNYVFSNRKELKILRSARAKFIKQFYLDKEKDLARNHIKMVLKEGRFGFRVIKIIIKFELINPFLSIVKKMGVGLSLRFFR